MTNIFPIDFEEKLTMAQDDYILFSDSEDGNKIKKAQYKNLKGEPGTPGQDGEDGAAATITVGSTTTGAAGSSASVTNSGTSSAAILDFTIPQGAKGEPGEDGQDGADGVAATITVGTTTTLPAGSSATVTNVGTSQDAILNFGIPKGDAGTGSGDVNGPASSVDGHLAVFDGATGKLIKDGGAVPEGNVKSFTLSSTSDLTNAQDAYDWYDSGKVAIIIYNDKEYFFDYATENNAYWSVANEVAYDTVSATGIQRAALQLALSSGSVTAITTLNLSVNDLKVLRTDKNYGTPYTPQYDGSPATKKYVDDGLSTKADTSSLGTAAACNTGTGSGNVPVLDSNGHLASSTIPGVALTDTFTVSTSSDLTSLSSADQGDIAIVTSENKTYVLSQAPYSTAANWKEILAPTGGVTSVNGSTGAVTVSEFTPGGTATTGYVVTKTANGYEWAAPSGGGDVLVSSQPNNILTSGMKIRAGEETDYANLGTYDSNCLYLTIPDSN